MPIQVILQTAKTATPELEKDQEFLANSISLPSTYDEKVVFDVTKVAIIRDIYERTYPAPKMEQYLSGPFSDTINQLEDPEILGQWNIGFLNFLNHISKVTSSPIKVQYIHERGDFLYEKATWHIDNTKNDGLVELNIECYDGSDKIQRRFNVTNPIT